MLSSLNPITVYRDQWEPEVSPLPYYRCPSMPFEASFIQRGNPQAFQPSWTRRSWEGVAMSNAR